MKTLYVIGNGFDRHHNINCLYSHFKEWIELYHHEFFFQMDEIYGWCDSDWWKDFENNLGKIDVMEYAQRIASENPVDLSSDHCDSMWNDAQIEVENQMKELYGNLQSLFEEWVAQLNEPDSQKRIYIDVHDATFLTFNYSRTLEELYGISPTKVLHIHGIAGSNDKLVFGHGMTLDALHESNPTPNDLYRKGVIDEEEASSYDIHDQWAWDEAFHQVDTMRKPVEDIIHYNMKFFEAIAGVEKVCVYGLSFSDVDVPYLRRILESAPNALWEVSCFNQDDIDKVNVFALNNGVRELKIVRLSELVDPNQMTICFP
jgi:hypothetical protein